MSPILCRDTAVTDYWLRNIAGTGSHSYFLQYYRLSLHILQVLLLLFVSVQAVIQLSLHITLLSLFGISLKFTPNFYTGSLFCLHYPSFLLFNVISPSLTLCMLRGSTPALDISHLGFFSTTANSSFSTSRLPSVITCLVCGCLKLQSPPNVYFCSTTSLDDFLLLQ